MDHEYSARVLIESCVLRNLLILTVDSVFMLSEKSSTEKGTYISSIWCRSQAGITTKRDLKVLVFFEKNFARLPVCCSTNAVIYCTCTRAAESQRSFLKLPTYLCRYCHTSQENWDELLSSAKIARTFAQTTDVNWGFLDVHFEVKARVCFRAFHSKKARFESTKSSRFDLRAAWQILGVHDSSRKAKSAAKRA